ncbi:hypothetical protein BCR32DRAFT_240634 [Anaeromyces robustus]|uniref:Uncharacterized protein n=1 Tax=Anaeromyces robustus TaxID=1754192 RepID=A0A1Y1XN32_9FUNG|nr:hypothetical protein BCR32DRAFT_240634 [Anaeromyces robustus]|eukprot:ORX86916.1 hypothetical protein BCR32DRAFT_240634 [Anaeromyces robustus]
MGDCLDLLGSVSSIFSYCSDLNQSFIRYKNHAKYLNDLALQLDSIYKLSENQFLLKEKEYNKYYKDKNNKDNNLINPYNNYKNELESSIPPVIIHFYNYTKKFIKHVKKIKAKNFVERLWYLSVNDEKMDMLESELDFIMKQFQIDTFSLLHGYVKNQKDTVNMSKEVSSLSQFRNQSATNSIKDLNESEDTSDVSNKQKEEDKIKRKEKEMKRKTKEMQKREYELIKELERLRRKNEKERKKRRELEKMEEYKYYKDILENDEKLYKKMLVQVPITPSSSSNNNTNNNNNNNYKNSSNNKLIASSKSQNNKDTLEKYF